MVISAASDNRAQLHTLEGFAAAMLMVGTVYLVVSAVTLSVPQTELHVDAQLKAYGQDALNILDTLLPPENNRSYYSSVLKNSVVGWMNGVEGATSFETDKLSNDTYTLYTSYKFDFRESSGCNDYNTFYVLIPSHTNISYAYLTLTGMPRLDTGNCIDRKINKKLPLVLSNASFPDHFGCAIAHGDVNDDGISDMVVGAYNSSSGAVYVYYGNNSSIGIWEDDGPNITITNPGASIDHFGWAVACGDVNGDGVDDVIVGAPENGTTDTGAVYLYNGPILTDTPAPDVVIQNPRTKGLPVNGRFGCSLACGDVNGDSFGDILIGAPTAREYVSDCGNAFVYFGGAMFSGTKITLYNPYNSSDYFGISVASVDINGDGLSDIVIGANAANRTYVRYGSTSLPPVINGAYNNEMNLTLHGESGSDFGISVSPAGDVNKDGVCDLIVGASANDSAHIFYGGSHIGNTSDINLTGESNSKFGISVSRAGDVDSDGYAGVIVGAPGSTQAEVEVFYDVDLGVDPIGISGASNFGSVVSYIGDVDADSIPDIAVGAPDAGEVYVYTPKFPEEPWLGVGNETEITTNKNGTKVWEYTTVIKTDNGNPLCGSSKPVTVGNSTDKTLPIYREITTDVNLSMYVKTSAPTNVTISVNGVGVADTGIATGGSWEWHDDITLPGDISEWKIGANNITIDVTSGGTLYIGLDDDTNKSIVKRMMIDISLPAVIQPFNISERTPDFAAAINRWTASHPLHGNLSDTVNISWTTQWIVGNDTGWIVPFRLHSNSSGAINVANVHIKATPSLDEYLDMLLPDFVEYNVIFAFLDTLTKWYLYTFSDGSCECRSTTVTFETNEDKTVNITLPGNVTEVYIARMYVRGSRVCGDSTAERVNTSSLHQRSPCIAANNSSVILIWTEGDGADQQIYSAVRSISTKPWSDAAPVNVSPDRQQAGTLGTNGSSGFVAWIGGDGADRRIYYTGAGGSAQVNLSTEAQTEPSIAVNSTGHVFLAWAENGSIHYSEYNRTAWSLPVRVNSSGESQKSPSLAVNSTGWAFVAWVQQNKIYYSEYNRTVWSPAVQISAASNQSSPTLAVNDSGWVFAAGVHETGADARVYYASYNRTNWSTPQRVCSDEFSQTDPDIAVDSNNNTRLVWDQCGGIRYSNSTGSGWSTPVVITDEGENPTIDPGSSGGPHVAWEHDDGVWYASGAVRTNYGHYPTLPYIAINNSRIWGYNITEINHGDTEKGHTTLCGNDSLTKIFDIDEDVTGPVIVSIYARGSNCNSTFDLYVNEEYARGGCMNESKIWWNLSVPSNFWRRNDNTVRIKMTSGCTDWYYANSTDGCRDEYHNQSNQAPLGTNETWMIRLYGHEYQGTHRTADFSDVLSGCLDMNATSDQEIPITIHSDSKGNITLSSLRVRYYIRGNETQVVQKRIITNGAPQYNSVTATRLVTIQYTDIPDSTEARNYAETRIPDASMAPAPITDLWNIVEVRLELWYK